MRDKNSTIYHKRHKLVPLSIFYCPTKCYANTSETEEDKKRRREKLTNNGNIVAGNDDEANQLKGSFVHCPGKFFHFIKGFVIWRVGEE